MKQRIVEMIHCVTVKNYRIIWLNNQATLCGHWTFSKTALLREKNLLSEAR
uniref:Uncharacterized protein n=1 Tax=Meloidogyne enterolobii TaxID=390850 RepID=A0A6V7UKH6_MELEN|nr:unnamed protein product [Meloidogyne enterolobii]